jgi:hypothetical protein
MTMLISSTFTFLIAVCFLTMFTSVSCYNTDNYSNNSTTIRCPVSAEDRKTMMSTMKELSEDIKTLRNELLRNELKQSSSSVEPNLTKNFVCILELMLIAILTLKFKNKLDKIYFLVKHRKVVNEEAEVEEVVNEEAEVEEVVNEEAEVENEDIEVENLNF